MNKRIFPINPNAKTWINYSNYLNWIQFSIKSIQDRLNYSYPSYTILNEPIDQIDIFDIHKTKSKVTPISAAFEDLIVYPELVSVESAEEMAKTGYFSSNPKDNVDGIQNYEDPQNARGFTRYCFRVKPGDVFEIVVGDVFLDVAPACFVDKNKKFVDHSITTLGTYTKEVRATAEYLIIQKSNSHPVSFTVTNIEGTIKTYKFISPEGLSWREGYYNPYSNTFLSFVDIPRVSNQYQLSGSDFADYVASKKLIEFPMSFVVFAKKWIHNGQFLNSPDSKSLSHYFLMAQSFAPLYGIQSAPNKLTFTCWKEGPGVMGSSFLFTVEASPSRYFALKQEEIYWEGGTTGFEILNYDWKTNEQIISSSKGFAWTNSYPIMSHLQNVYIKEDESISIEDFVADCNVSSSLVNIENHITVKYNILTNEQPEDTRGWGDLVYVMLI